MRLLKRGTIMSGMTSLKGQLSDGITSIVGAFDSKKQLKVSAKMVDSQASDNWGELKEYMYAAMFLRNSALSEIAAGYGISVMYPINQADFDKMSKEFTASINNFHKIKEDNKVQLAKFLALQIITNRIDSSNIEQKNKDLIAKTITDMIERKSPVLRKAVAANYIDPTLDEYVTNNVMVKEMAGGLLSKKNPLRVAAGAVAQNMTGLVTGHKSIKHQLFDTVKDAFDLVETTEKKKSMLDVAPKAMVKGQDFTAHRQIVREALGQIFFHPDVAAIIFDGKYNSKQTLLSEDQVATLQALLNDAYIVAEFNGLLKKIIEQLVNFPKLTGDKNDVVQLAIKKLFANQNLVAKITEIVGGKVNTGLSQGIAGKDAALVAQIKQKAASPSASAASITKRDPSPDRKPPVTFAAQSSEQNSRKPPPPPPKQQIQGNANSQGVLAPQLQPRKPGDKKT